MAEPLESAVSEVITTLGYELVEFRQAGSPKRPLLQVRIDRLGEGGSPRPAEGSVSADDCARASRALEATLEERGLVGAEYTLEVSSPGSDRPLKNAADWRRFLGQRVKVKHQAVQGTVYGTVEAIDDISAHRTLVTVRREDGTETMELDLALMREARLAPKFEAPPKPGKGDKAVGRSGGKKDRTDR